VTEVSPQSQVEVPLYHRFHNYLLYDNIIDVIVRYLVMFLYSHPLVHCVHESKRRMHFLRISRTSTQSLVSESRGRKRAGVDTLPESYGNSDAVKPVKPKLPYVDPQP